MLMLRRCRLLRASRLGCRLRRRRSAELHLPPPWLHRLPRLLQPLLLLRRRPTLLLPLLPFLLLTLGVILAWRYPLKHGVYDKLAAYLKHRDMGVPEGALPPEEVERLKEQLI